MSKKNVSGLTGSSKTRSERLLAHFDIIDRHRHRAEIIAGLMDQCYASDRVDPEVISDAAGMIHDELTQMREKMSAMYKDALK